MLLALDPSSTCTGWALFDGPKCINSGTIILPDTGWWDEYLADEMQELMCSLINPDDPLTVLIEDISNRSNKGAYFGPPLFQWAKAVGICLAAVNGKAEIKRYPSNWLVGKPYAKCKLAREKKFRILCAQAYRPEVTQVDEATAVLFGVFYQTASPSLFDWKPPKKKERRGDGKLFDSKSPTAGTFQTQPVVANGLRRPGRRLNFGS